MKIEEVLEELKLQAQFNDDAFGHFRVRYPYGSLYPFAKHLESMGMTLWDIRGKLIELQKDACASVGGTYNDIKCNADADLAVLKLFTLLPQPITKDTLASLDV